MFIIFLRRYESLLDSYLIQAQQSTLFYHLGVRESFGMRQNILLYHDQDKESTLALKVSCANYSFVSYHMASDNTLVISENSVVPDSHRVSLVHQLKRLLKDLEVQSKVGSYFIQYIHYINLTSLEYLSIF